MFEIEQTTQLAELTEVSNEVARISDNHHESRVRDNTQLTKIARISDSQNKVASATKVTKIYMSRKKGVTRQTPCLPCLIPNCK